VASTRAGEDDDIWYRRLVSTRGDPVSSVGEPTWLGRTGWFRTVDGWKPVTDLLGEPRMHADFLSLFDGLGVSSGLVRDVVASSLLSMNGADHKRFRSVVASSFTPKSVDAVRPTARREAHRCIDRFASAGECEFVDAFAMPYVAAVTCAFLGIPPDELDTFLPYVRLVNSREPDLDRRAENWSEGLLGLAEYGRSLLARREHHPTGDVVSMIATSVKREELPELVAVGLMAGLLSAGHDPTINQLGIMIEVMSAQPGLWDAVAEGQAEPAPVVEEVLRFRPTNHQVSRRVAEDLEYDGVAFAEGEHVVIRLVSANHDGCRFAKPDEFDLDANHGSHLAFGYGAHYCLGAALARVQLQEGLRALTGRLRCPTVDESKQKEPEGGIVGPASLSISFDQRSPQPVSSNGSR